MPFDGVNYKKVAPIYKWMYYGDEAAHSECVRRILRNAYWYAKNHGQYLGHQTFGRNLRDWRTSVINQFNDNTAKWDIATFRKEVGPQWTHIVADIFFSFGYIEGSNQGDHTLEARFTLNVDTVAGASSLNTTKNFRGPAVASLGTRRAWLYHELPFFGRGVRNHEIPFDATDRYEQLVLDIEGTAIASDLPDTIDVRVEALAKTFPSGNDANMITGVVLGYLECRD